MQYRDTATMTTPKEYASHVGWGTTYTVSDVRTRRDDGAVSASG